MERNLIAPRVDVVFRVLFGRERNKDMLVDLLNAVLRRPKGQEIVEIEVLNVKVEQEWLEQKNPVLDILARDRQGSLIEIEIQCRNHPYFLERVLYYWSRLYGQQLKEGELYTKLRPVISIVFTDFNLFAGPTGWKTRWMWREDDGRVLTNHGEIHIIELRKLPNIEDMPENKLVKWAKFLKEGETMSLEQIQAWEEPAIKKAYEELEKLSQDPEMRMHYELRLKGLTDYLSDVNSSYEEGKKSGLEEGEKLGLEKGKKSGLEEGEKLGLEKGEKLGLEKGKKSGLEEGEKLGLEKGVGVGQIVLLQSQARKRFPQASETTIRLIEELNGESLQELAEAILDVADGRAFRHLLLQLKQKSTPEHPKDSSES